MIPASFAAPLLAAALGAASFTQPLTEAQRAEAIAWIASMKANPRGPFVGVAWYCKDGSIQQPRPYACADRGGGHQYGVPSREAQKLADLGIYVGTVLTALPPDAFLDEGSYRARAFVIEAYLERALDGWTLASAKSYRGFRQIEDEQEAARWHLIELCQRREVLGPRRSLVMRLMRAMPYGRQGSLADEVRALAGLLGDADTAFADLRFKIHAMPEPTDIPAVEAYLQGKTGELLELGNELLEKMRLSYDPAARLARLSDVRKWIWDRKAKAAIGAFLETDPSDPIALIERGAEVIDVVNRLPVARRDPKQGERNLLALHVMGLVEELWVTTTAPLSRMPLSRAQTLGLLERLFTSAAALGSITQRELDQLRDALERARGGDPARYVQAVEDLARVLEWARARVVADLDLALGRYEAVEPRALGVIDDILRSGIMLPLAALLDRLGADTERLLGGGHRLVGIAARSAGLRGDNAGFAVGPLAVLRPGEDAARLRRHEIALLHTLPPDLPPVAGILTVGRSGSLSHVALLARNLGIPLATLDGDVAAALQAGSVGKEVVLGVSTGRRVLLGPLAAFPESERKVFARPKAPQAAVLSIDAAALDLTSTRILALAEVGPADSGVRVGPKAAELGRLRKLFPERVSDAAVIPFGAFVRHVDRPAEDGGPSPLARLKEAYARARGQASGEEALLAELARFRQSIAELPFAPGFEDEVTAALDRLGKPGTFGVFVRSDTNVEDLEQFTGAGLNKTVANRVRRDAILAAIREVWASPFTERSFAWRQKLLKNPEHVYPSVILHRTVPSEISGVLVTVDLEGRTPGAITVSASEGVAAVVDGGAPETVVIGPDRSIRLLSSSRTATRKLIPRPPREGVIIAPAEERDPLLGPAEQEELVALAEEVRAKIPQSKGLPWDIELGFVGGKAWLMQIRPLRTDRTAATHPTLAALDTAVKLPAGPLDMQENLP